jgi:hypothetical protein
VGVASRVNPDKDFMTECENRMDRHLTNTPSLSTDLRNLALDGGRRNDFVAACQAAYTGHQALSEIVEATAGTRWRFLVTKSGSGIDMRHKDDMYAEFWESVAEVKSGQGAFGKDEYEQEVRDLIDSSFVKQKQICLFLTEADNLMAFDRAMAMAFEGRGYRYNDGAIVSDDDDGDVDREVDL